MPIYRADQQTPAASLSQSAVYNPYSTSTPATSAPSSTAPSGGWDPSKATGSVFKGFTPKYAMEGFDFAREQNTGKSAKDAFAYLSNQAPPPPINNKGALGAWFKQYIEPGMNALGHKVNRSGDDWFNFSNWQGTFDVDFGRGAGADGGALAWQVDDGSAQMANGGYTPTRTLTDPRSGQPVSTTMPVSAPVPYQQAMSSAITYRRPYNPATDDALVP